MELTFAPFVNIGILLPIIIPLGRCLYRYIVAKTKVTFYFIIEAVFRSVGVAVGISHSLGTFQGVFASGISFDIYSNVPVLNFIGALFIFNYVWNDLTKFLDSKFRKINRVKSNKVLDKA